MNFIPCQVVDHDGRPSLALKADKGGTCYIPAQGMCTSVRELDNQEVILGIRPEQISAWASSEQENNSVYKLTCKAHVVEPTGPDTLVFTQINSEKTTCRIHPDKAVRAGESMTIGLDISKAVLFDPETQKRID
jgi:multiple sugar transport system ATP-binding protein